MMKLLLPSAFRTIGLIMCASSLLYVFVLIFMNFGSDGTNLWILEIPWQLFMVSMVFVISARRTVEDEMIATLRLAAFQRGLYLGVIISFSYFVLNLMGLDFRLLKALHGINFILLYVVLSFEYQLRKLNHEE